MGKSIVQRSYDFAVVDDEDFNKPIATGRSYKTLKKKYRNAKLRF